MSADDWWRGAVYYEIYVRSFQDANGDGIGDLAGITRRLDYLNDGTPRSLGVDALWLTPINPSPMFDFGYDVSDYTAVDPLFGSLGDLDRLLAEAHRRGLHVILDLVHDIIRGWRRLLDRHGERMMVGEVYLLDPVRVAAYHGAANDELQLAFNFAFQWTPWDAAQFRQRVEEVERLWPPGAQPTYVLSSHDAPRHRTRFDDPVHGDARARVAALMLLTLRGTPFLYYGEELGMRDGDIPPERICDPVGKRFPALGRDPERTPMPWDASRNAGFSPVDPWLPLGAEWPTVNVAAQLDDPDSMLSLYRRVIWWRKSSPALLEGDLRLLDGPAETFVYAREHAGQRLVVALNFSTEPAVVPLPAAGRVALSTVGREGPVHGPRPATGGRRGCGVRRVSAAVLLRRVSGAHAPQPHSGARAPHSTGRSTWTGN